MQWLKFNYDIIPAVLGVILGGILSIIAANFYYIRAKEEGFKPKIFHNYNPRERKLLYIAFLIAALGIATTLLIMNYIGYYVLENGVPILHHLGE